MIDHLMGTAQPSSLVTCQPCCLILQPRCCLITGQSQRRPNLLTLKVKTSPTLRDIVTYEIHSHLLPFSFLLFCFLVSSPLFASLFLSSPDLPRSPRPRLLILPRCSPSVSIISYNIDPPVLTRCQLTSTRPPHFRTPRESRPIPSGSHNPINERQSLLVAPHSLRHHHHALLIPSGATPRPYRCLYTLVDSAKHPRAYSAPIVNSPRSSKRLEPSGHGYRP
jgi:hypothetical protein